MKLTGNLHLVLRLRINGMNRDKFTFTYLDHVGYKYCFSDKNL